MNPSQLRYVKLSAIVAVVALIYSLPIPGLDRLGPLQPAVVAAIFVFLTFRFGIRSWTLTLAFCFALWVQTIVLTYLVTSLPAARAAGLETGLKGAMAVLVAVFASPVTLFAPLVAASLIHVLLQRWMPNYRLERP